MQPTGSNLRFAEYFFRAGLDPKCNLLKSKLPDIKVEEQASAPDEDGANAEVRENSRAATRERNEHPLSYRYEADTLYRYPPQDYSDDEKYPPYTPMFCFPKDVSFISHENGKPPDSYHSFIITESTGAKTYGVCLKTYVSPGLDHASQIEAMITDWRTQNLVPSDYEFAQHVQTQLAYQKEQLLKMKLGVIEQTPQSTHAAEETITVLEELINPLRQSVLVEPETVYVPTCIGVLSRWPWYDFLKDWLCLVVSSIQNSDFERFPFERCAINLIHEIPLPPPGKLEISVPFGNQKLYLSRPPINTPQLLKNYSCYPLFRAMSIENIVTLFELLLTEYKVILVSEHASMLTLTCESLCSWLYPFYWHHILIPVLPSRLISYLQAPVPFLVGIQKESFPEWKEDGWKPLDAAVVDIDNDLIDFPPLKVKIPSRERKKLIQHLERHSGQLHHVIRKGVPETMKYAFPYGKLPLQTGESVIGHRRIKDIPQSMYTTYSNVFLQEKRTAGLKGASPLRPSTTTSEHHHDIHSSFDNIGGVMMAPAFSKSKIFYSATPSVVQSEAPSDNSEAPSLKNLAVESSAANLVRESIGSFIIQTPRSSVPDQSVESNSVSEVGSSAKEPSSILPRIQTDGNASVSNTSKSSTEVVAIPEPPLKVETGGSPTKKSNIPWWQKLTASSVTTTPAASSKTSRPPSLFDKFLGGPATDSHTPQLVINNTIAESPEKLAADQHSIPTTSPIVSPQSPNITHTNEGHIFHELCLNEYQEKVADIDEEMELAHDEEYADRFTPDSGSSDDMSRSDISVTTDIRPQLFGASGHKKTKSLRNAGQQRSASIISATGVVPKRELSRVRHETSPTMTKGPRIKTKGALFNECNVCREDLDARKHTVLMCQYCHVQIHHNCLPLASPCEMHFNEEKIANGFFKIFTSVFRHYRSYLKIPVAQANEDSQEMSNMTMWFRKTDFLAEFDTESKPFMTILLETQAFAQFVLDRVERPENDYEVLYFDESIKQKMNRSRMRFSKEATPFLTETTYQISQGIETLPFNNTNLPLGTRTLLFNIVDNLQGFDLYDWRKAYEVTPRPIQHLVTEEDQKMMRSHTTELVNRSRLHARTKYDFSKWVRMRWKSGKDEDTGSSYISDDQRREALEENVNQVSAVIDHYESAHISSQTYTQLESAVNVLVEQNQKLLHASDEEQLVDNYMFQHTLTRLMRVISIYQEQLAKLPPPIRVAANNGGYPDKPPPLPPRKSPVTPLVKSATDDIKISSWVSSIFPGSASGSGVAIGSSAGNASSKSPNSSANLPIENASNPPSVENTSSPLETTPSASAPPAVESPSSIASIRSSETKSVGKAEGSKSHSKSLDAIDEDHGSRVTVSQRNYSFVALTSASTNNLIALPGTEPQTGVSSEREGTPKQRKGSVTSRGSKADDEFYSADCVRTPSMGSKELLQQDPLPMPSRSERSQAHQM